MYNADYVSTEAQTRIAPSMRKIFVESLSSLKHGSQDFNRAIDRWFPCATSNWLNPCRDFFRRQLHILNLLPNEAIRISPITRVENLFLITSNKWPNRCTTMLKPRSANRGCCGSLLKVFQAQPEELVTILYSDEISGRIPVSESSYSITQKEYLKSIYGNYK